MTPVAEGPAKGHRMLVLSNISQTNDGVESNWPKRYYIACFSLSRYEDVAMWLNYGKKSASAVRIKFTRDSIEKWKGETHRVYYAKGPDTNGFSFTEDISSRVDSVNFYGMAYVIPSRHWVTPKDEIYNVEGNEQKDPIIQDANIEQGRAFYHVWREGKYDWVDDIYDRKDLSKLGLPPVFKKRGWAYEREIRLVVELTQGWSDYPKHIGIAFDEPLNKLKDQMKLSKEDRKTCELGGLRTPHVKVWDPRFPPVQSGPWYKDAESDSDPICGLSLTDAFKSEYSDEIRVFQSPSPVSETR